ncbi:hypothetical protein F4810DRAFT_690066 [Camillea tinctor]|nr:hypothetical protein F4810DRAFT_690066 [Camillea tinctor]
MRHMLHVIIRIFQRTYCHCSVSGSMLSLYRSLWCIIFPGIGLKDNRIYDWIEIIGMYLYRYVDGNITIQPKANALTEILGKVSKYPPDTIFHFYVWTFSHCIMSAVSNASHGGRPML